MYLRFTLFAFYHQRVHFRYTGKLAWLLICFEQLDYVFRITKVERAFLFQCQLECFKYSIKTLFLLENILLNPVSIIKFTFFLRLVIHCYNTIEHSISYVESIWIADLLLTLHHNFLFTLKQTAHSIYMVVNH